MFVIWSWPSRWFLCKNDWKSSPRKTSNTDWSCQTWYNFCFLLPINSTLQSRRLFCVSFVLREYKNNNIGFFFNWRKKLQARRLFCDSFVLRDFLKLFKIKKIRKTCRPDVSSVTVLFWASAPTRKLSSVVSTMAACRWKSFLLTRHTTSRWKTGFL